MTEAFLTEAFVAEAYIALVNRSIISCWLILAVLVIRILLKKAPKYIHCFLWCLVGIRLILPFSLESVFSLIPSGRVVEPGIVYSHQPSIETGIEPVDSVVNPIIIKNFEPNVGDSVNPLQVAAILGSWIWILGIAAMLLYTGIIYFRLMRRMSDAVRLEGNIFQSEKAATPFVLGIFRPRIYIPYTLKEKEQLCVIAHEQAHIRRRDHLLKPIAFCVLAVYWFHPLVWLAYVLLCRDIELACDERVIREIGMARRKVYSETLLNCSARHGIIAACPLAFDETGVKRRIKNILHYKKPTVWILGLSVALCAAAAVCFMTDPKTEPKTEPRQVSDEGSEDVFGEERKGLLAEEGQIEDEQLEDEENTMEAKLPPTMYLQDVLSSKMNFFQVEAGSYSWDYEKDGEMVHMDADAEPPQSAVKGKYWLQLLSYNKMDQIPYIISFPIRPNRITVKQWDLLDLGDSNGELLSEETYEELLIDLEPRRIYEVTAEWDKEDFSENGFYGQAHYAFATDNYIKEEGVTLDAVVKEYVKEIMGGEGNQIVVVSETDSFPGEFVVNVPMAVYDAKGLAEGEHITLTIHDIGRMDENQRPVYEAAFLKTAGS